MTATRITAGQPFAPDLAIGDRSGNLTVTFQPARSRHRSIAVTTKTAMTVSDVNDAETALTLTFAIDDAVQVKASDWGEHPQAGLAYIVAADEAGNTWRRTYRATPG